MWSNSALLRLGFSDGGGFPMGDPTAGKKSRNSACSRCSYWFDRNNLRAKKQEKHGR